MKTTNKLLVLALMAVAVVFASCGSDDNDDPVVPTNKTTGVATRTGGISVKWVQLWKGGPKFAEYNVGATHDMAEDYGKLYAWGGSQDKVDDHNTGSVVLKGTDDTATKLWGGNWRMPTQAELQALIANCDIEWTTIGIVDGYKLTGRGDFSSNSVFLPASGFCDGLGRNFDLGVNGYYWSSTPDGSDNAFCLLFGKKGNLAGSRGRHMGFSVRAVLAE